MRLIGPGILSFAGDIEASIPNAPSSRITGMLQEVMSKSGSGSSSEKSRSSENLSSP